MSLLVIVPTRTRKAQCERLIESFEKTTDSAELLFVVDGDDDSYETMDWRGHSSSTMSPRGSLAQKLNHTVDAVLDKFDQIMWTGDDHEFVTEHWDTLLLETLEKHGGSGWVYPDNGRRKDVPESWLCSSDVIRELNWYANPILQHYYIDNSIAVLGKRTGLMYYAPDVKIPHHHYSVDKQTEYDALYKETETSFGQADAQAFATWHNSPMASGDVSRLRRKFNSDVAWAIEKVA
jgi:hypothetical protein